MVTVQDAGGPAPGDLASVRQRGDAAATSILWIVLWIVTSSIPLMSCADTVDMYCATHRSYGHIRTLIKACLFVLIFILPLFVNALYGARHGGTYGMVKCGIAYARHPGGQMSRLRCFVRALAGILCMPLLPISLLTTYLDAHRRSLADFLCGTTVRIGGWDRPSRIRGFPHFGRHTAMDGIDASPYCNQCGYSLRGLEIARCPECGMPFRPSSLEP